MSPTMVHTDEARGLVFTWHGDTTIHVYTTEDFSAVPWTGPHDTIDMDDESPCCMSVLKSEADFYVA